MRLKLSRLATRRSSRSASEMTRSSRSFLVVSSKSSPERRSDETPLMVTSGVRRSCETALSKADLWRSTSFNTATCCASEAAFSFGSHLDQLTVDLGNLNRVLLRHQPTVRLPADECSDHCPRL